MRFIVRVPSEHASERAWALRVLLREFLGLDYDIETSPDAQAVGISFGGKTLTVRDDALSKDGSRLIELARSTTLLPKWCVADDGIEATQVSGSVPVLFGAPGFEQHATGDATLSLDVFGSAFFMLSRFEESVANISDEHERFPSSASVASRNGFLDRPIIDEYCEILWAAMKRVWPGLRRKELSPTTFVTSDLDAPFEIWSAAALTRRMAGRLRRDRTVAEWPALVRNYVASLRGDYSLDPMRSTVDWMMDVNEKAGNRMAFYFVAEWTHDRDTRVRLDSRRMRSLLREIHQRGHEIGLHPGYQTYRTPDAFARSTATLRRVMAEERVEQEEIGGRQHYLRFDVRSTPQLWEANGLAYDSSLAYAENIGFRCGTSREYPMFDLVTRTPLKLRQRPLILMEVTVLGQSYMGMPYDDDALALMLHYKRVCHQFGGRFTILWHTSQLSHPKAREFYTELIS